jgi:5-methylcytosine-specific restriction enzyme subunit McrC
MRLRLSEYRTEYAVPLSIAERDALRDVRDLTVQPSPGTSGRYDITPGSTIGAFEVGSLAVQIRPKVPIDRVLFLLSYTHSSSTWQATGFNFDEEDSLVEAIVPGFIRQVQQATRRGLLQGYRTEDDALTTVRGRIQMNELVGRRHGIMPPIDVHYDEFTEDIEINRLIKAAVTQLRSLRLRSSTSVTALRSLDGSLASVSAVAYDPRRLPSIAWTRLNEHYRPAVALAKLILQSSSFEHRHGSVRFCGFLIDMNKIFEDFVVVALREALGLDERHFRQGDARLRLDEARRVTLQPDISWWEGGTCRFVGDLKYKRAGSHGAHNPDVYQMLSYLIAADLPAGLLIYAAGEPDEVVHDIVNIGRCIAVNTVDVSGSPEQILVRIGRVAQQIKAYRIGYAPRSW